MSKGGVNGHLFSDEARALQDAGVTLSVAGDLTNYPRQAVVGCF